MSSIFDDLPDVEVGVTSTQVWRRSEHAVLLSRELIRITGAPIGDSMWRAVESVVPPMWATGRCMAVERLAQVLHAHWDRITSGDDR